MRRVLYTAAGFIAGLIAAFVCTVAFVWLSPDFVIGVARGAFPFLMSLPLTDAAAYDLIRGAATMLLLGALIGGAGVGSIAGGLFDTYLRRKQA